MRYRKNFTRNFNRLNLSVLLYYTGFETDFLSQRILLKVFFDPRSTNNFIQYELTSRFSFQCQRLGMLRAQFLRLIENHDVKEDLNCRYWTIRFDVPLGKKLSRRETFVRGVFGISFRK